MNPLRNTIRPLLRRITTGFLLFTQILGIGLFPFGPLQIFAPQVAHAEIPSTLGYQGRLKNSSGNPLTGTYSFQFRLYDALSGGSLLWTETQPSVSADSGFFSVRLGSVTPFPITLDFNQPLYLSTEVNSDGEMSPRLPVNSVGYAYTTGGINSTSTTPASGTGGRMIYNTTTGLLEYYDGTASIWRTLGSSSATLQLATDGGNTTTNPIQFAGGTSTGSFTVSGGFNFGNATGTSLVLTGSTPSNFTNLVWTNATGTNTTSTNLFATTASLLNASATTLTVGGQNVCLANGTNCAVSTLSGETLAVISARGASATTTLQLFGGFIGASSTVTSTLTVLGATSLQGTTITNATATNATTTNLFATTASLLTVSSTTLTVGGQNVCLANGTNCPSVGSSTDTLAVVSARGAFATTTLQLYGGFVGSSSTVTSTLTVLGNTSLQGTTLTDATATNVTTTNLAATMVSTTNITGTNATFTNLALTTLSSPTVSSTNITWTNATGTNTTTTNLFATTAGLLNVSSTVLTASSSTISNLTFTNGTSTNWLGFATASGTNLYAGSVLVNGQPVCLSDGTNCPVIAAGTSTLQSITNNGATTSKTLTLFGGFVGASSTVTGTLTVLGGAQIGGGTSTGDFLPSADVTYALGSALFRWNGFFGSLSATTGTITNLLATSGTITNLTGTNATFTNLGVTNLTVSSTTPSSFTNLTWTNATGTNTTTTNLGATNANLLNVSSTFLTINGQQVCLGNGLNCLFPSSTSTLQAITNNGNTTTNALQFAGGTSTADFLPSADVTYSLGSALLRWNGFFGALSATTGTITNLLTTSGTITTLNNTTLNGGDATFNNTTTTNASTTNLYATNFNAGTGTITNLTGTNATFTNLAVTNLTVSSTTPSVFTNLIWTNATGTNTTSTNLFATTAGLVNVTTSFLTVGGQQVCLGNGTNCLYPSTTATLQYITNNGNTTTNALQFAGGTSTADFLPSADVTYSLGSALFRWNGFFGALSATTGTITNLLTTSGTITTLNNTTLNGGDATFNNVTSTNIVGTTVSSTNILGTNATFTNLVVSSTSPAVFTNLIWTNATGTNTTSTNLFATNGTITNGTITNGTFTNATSGWLGFTTASGTTLNAASVLVNGQTVCLSNGTNCPSLSSGTTTLQTVAANGATTSYTLVLYGGSISSSSTVTSTLTVLGGAQIGGGTSTGDFLPSADVTYALGSALFRWNGFFGALSATTGTITNLLTTSGTITTLNNTTLNGGDATFNNVTSTNIAATTVTTTNITGTNATFTNLGVTNLTVSSTSPSFFTNLTWTNATGTNTTSTNLFATTAGLVNVTTSFLTVGGQQVCLGNGTNCLYPSTTATLQYITNNGNTTTNALQFAGGTSTADFLPSADVTYSLGSALFRWNGFFGALYATTGTITNLLTTSGTITTLNNTTLNGGDATFNNVTSTNIVGTTVSSTNILGTNATFTNLVVSSTSPAVFTNLIWTNATGTNTTSTNLFATNGTITNGTITNGTFTNATSGWLGFTTASGTTLNAASVLVNGQTVCLSNGTNCPSLSSGTTTLQTVAANGATTSYTLILYGGSISSSSTVTSTLTVLGGAQIGGGTSTGDFLPSADVTYALGSALFRWNGFFGALSATTGTITNLISTSGTITTLNNTTLNGGDATFNNVTSTNIAATTVTTTNITGTNATFTNLGVTNLTVSSTSPSFFTNLTWTNATGTNTTSTNLFATTAGLVNVTTSFLTVGGQQVCLGNGTNCLYPSTTATLQYITNNGNTTTNALQFAGGTSTADFLPSADVTYSLGSALFRWNGFFGALSATTGTITNLLTTSGTITTLNNTTLNGGDATFNNTTTTNASTTNLYATNFNAGTGTITNLTGTNATFTNLAVTNLTVSSTTPSVFTNLIWTNATGTNTTSTNLYAASGWILNASATTLTVSGQNVCLANGTNCPSATTPNLQTVTNTGNTTTNALQFAGGTSTADFVPSVDATYYLGTSTFRWNGAFALLTANTGTITNLLATSGTIATLNNTTLNGGDATFNNVTSTNIAATTVTTTNITGTNATFTNLAVTNLTVSSTTPSIFTNLIWTNATGTNTTSTNLFATTAVFTNVSSTNATISGGSINGTPIGATTPSTGAFTGLTWTNATGTNTTSTNFYASTAWLLNVSSTSLTVGGQQVCLGNGTNCLYPSTTATLQYITNNGNTTTNALQFAGGTSTADFLPSADVTYSLGSALLRWNGFFGSLSASTGTITNLITTSGTITTLNNTTLNGGNATFNNVTSTNFVATNATATTLAVTNLFVSSTSPSSFTNLIWTNATGTNTTTTNLFATTAGLLNVSSTTLTVGGQNVCLANGTNCQVSSLTGETLGVVSARGAGATTTLNLFGGFLASSSTVTSTFTVVGNTTLAGVTATNVTTTNLGVNGSVNTNLIPVGDATLSLGSASFRWNGNFGSVTATNVTTTNLATTILTATTGTITNLLSTSATIATINNSTLNGGNATFNNSTSTNFVATNATATTLSVTNLTAGSFTPTNITWTNATGTNTTSTNLFATTARLLNVSSTTLTVGGQQVCLGNGTNCLFPSSTSTLQATTNNGALTTNTLSLFGGFLASSSTVTSTFTVVGNTTLAGTTMTNATATAATTTNLFATTGWILTASTTALTVSGQQVCLANGTNCPADTITSSTFQYSAANGTAFLTTSTFDVLLGGSTTATAGFIWDFTPGASNLLIGASTNTNLIIGGTSSTQTGLNAAYAMSGDDLFVHGNIGSVSSVYTNGEFVAGTGSAHYGNGQISQTTGNMVMSVSGGFFTPLTDLGVSLGSSSLRWNAILGNTTSTAATTTNLFATTGWIATASTTALTVGGQNVCLANGTNCQVSSLTGETLGVVSARGAGATTTLNLFGGFLASSSTVTSTFTVVGNTTLAGTTMTNATATAATTTNLFATTGWILTASTTALTVSGQQVCLASGTNCPSSTGITSSTWQYNTANGTAFLTTSTLDVLLGGSTTATAGFIWDYRAGTSTLVLGGSTNTNVLIGTSTYQGGLNSQFQVNGNDLIAQGAIGAIGGLFSATSVFSNRNFVVDGSYNGIFGPDAFPNHIASTDPVGISTYTSGTVKSGFFTEVSGTLLSFAINSSQAGDRVTSTIGAIFRLDTRPNTPYWSLKRQPASNTQVEISDFQISTDGFFGFGAGHTSDLNTFGGLVHLFTASTTKPVEIIQGAQNQTADLTQWWNSSSTPLLAISATGSLEFLTATGTIQINTSSTLNIVSSSTNLLTLRQPSVNFGASLSSGAFMDRNSSLQEEFNKQRSSISADTTGSGGGGFGDGGGWGVYEGGASSSCTVSSLADTANGIMRLASNTTSNGCLVMMDESINNLHGIFTAGNLPVMLMKVRPSNVSNANNYYYAGIGDATDGSTSAPSNFIGFSNNGTTGWVGITRSGGTQTAVTCTGSTISTTNFGLLMVEVRSTTDVHFFFDDNVSDGVSFSECDGGSQTNIPTGNYAPELINQSRTGSSSANNFDVDFFRAWQDDGPEEGGSASTTTDYTSMTSIAAYYPADDVNLPVGTVMSLDTSTSVKAVPTSMAYDPDFLGVVVNDPGVILSNGSFDGVRIATQGRVMAFASLENGDIHIGDIVTTASTTGMLMKAAGPGPALGRALGELTGATSTTGTILIQIQPSYYVPTQNGHLFTQDLTAHHYLQVGVDGVPQVGPSAIAQFQGTTDTYLQVNLQNNSTGTNASSDYVATADNGDDSSYFIDMGINGSQYSNPDYSIGGANDGYIYVNGGNFTVGTASSTDLIFHTGGTLAENERMRITSGGWIGIGTSTPIAMLDVNGDAHVNGTLSVTDLLVGGQHICLADGTNCKSGSTYASSTSGSVSLNGTEQELLSLNVSPTTNDAQVWVTANVRLTASGNSADALLRLHSVACTGTQVGIDRTSAISSSGDADNIAVSFVDTPATTSTVHYVLCAASSGSNVNASERSITAQIVNAGVDLAEVYYTNDSTLGPGDVVSLDPAVDGRVQRSSGINDQKAIGVVSTQPGVLLSVRPRDGGLPVMVALSGRIPVKFSEENGAVEPGDYLAPASEAGKAMKASNGGMVIGQVLSRPNESGMVMMFVKNMFWSDASAQTSAMASSIQMVVEQMDSVSTTLAAVSSSLQMLTGRIDELNTRVATVEDMMTGLSDRFPTTVETAWEIVNDVHFTGRATFNSDTGGFALIHTGDRRAHIAFDKEYEQTPVVNVSVTFENTTSSDGEAEAQTYFDSGLQYLILKKSTTGFDILFNKPVPVDVMLSWTALAVKDAKTFSSIIESIPSSEPYVPYIPSITPPEPTTETAPPTDATSTDEAATTDEPVTTDEATTTDAVTSPADSTPTDDTITTTDDTTTTETAPPAGDEVSEPAPVETPVTEPEPEIAPEPAPEAAPAPAPEAPPAETPAP